MHTHGTDDGPPGGVGWIILDAIVCATAVALVGIFAQWLLAERRRARAALAEYGGPDSRPLVPLPDPHPHSGVRIDLGQLGTPAPVDLRGGQGDPDPESQTSSGR